MKRSWAACAAALAAIFVIAGCNDYGNTFQGNTGAVLSFISPSDINAGGPDLVLTMNGSGFVPKTVVQWNGKTLATTVTLDSSNNVLSVTAVVPAALTAKAGAASVNTLNPFSGAGNNGLSNTINFTINPPANPLPVVTDVNPKTAPAGSGDTQITITGTQFLSGGTTSTTSQVFWTAGGTQSTLTTGTISSGSITATIPAADLATAGTATISVYNPPYVDPNCKLINCPGSGGGTSVNTPTFTITTGAAAKTAVDETPALSSDGRYVAYSALVNGQAQIFLRDTCEGANANCHQNTSQISVASDGSPANVESHAPSMSADGRYVAFSSAATNLTADAPSGRQIYMRDTCFGASADCKVSTQLISTDAKGALVGTESILPSVSASGRYVAFVAVMATRTTSQATAAAKSGTTTNSGYRQVFVRDTCLGVSSCTAKTTRISMQPGDGTEENAKPAGPSLSGTANKVAALDARTATLFTKSTAVDDCVFLSVTKDQQ